MKTLIVLAFLLGLTLLEGCKDQRHSTQSENFQEYVSENATKDVPDSNALINIQF